MQQGRGREGWRKARFEQELLGDQRDDPEQRIGVLPLGLSANET
jgi:hypothetical protein